MLECHQAVIELRYDACMLGAIYSTLGAISHAISPQNDEINRWEKQCLLMVGAQKMRLANPEQDSKLLGMIDGLYQKANRGRRAKIILYESKFPNAVSLHSDAIAVSTGALNVLDHDEAGRRYPKEKEGELEGLIAHEMSHQKQYLTNLLAMGIYAVTPLLTGMLAVKAVNKKASGWWKDNLTVMATSFGVVATAAQYLFAIPYAAFRRGLEYAADKGSGYITGKPAKWATGLRKMTAFQKKELGAMGNLPSTDSYFSAVSLPNTHFAKGVDLQDTMGKLYSAHPPTDDRAIRLEKQQAEMDRLSAGAHATRLIQQAEESHVSSSLPKF